MEEVHDVMYNIIYCRGANRRNRYPENPPNCMGGIREFNCACLIVSLVLTLLLIHPTVLHCRVLFPGLYNTYIVISQ
jgi:hypothetical protein